MYERLKRHHDRLAATYGQGEVELVTTATAPGPEPWDPPTTVTTYTPVNATVRGVGAEMVDGVNIVASDLIVQIAAIENPPEVGDTIRIDGQSMAVLATMPIPAAGEPTAIKIIARG
jgi:hypothetical protein